MRISGLDRKIFQELKKVTGLKRLRSKDFTEYRTVKFELASDEEIVFLPVLGVWASYRVR